MWLQELKGFPTQEMEKRPNMRERGENKHKGESVGLMKNDKIMKLGTGKNVKK